jgi:pimeloyl-ACP methyl ester carboxylesterase
MLHRAGYRCLAPDTLGCGYSEMAPRLGDYHALKITGDHRALLEHLGIEQSHVVGHDWGAVIGWLFAAHFPRCTQSLVAMSVGHPTAYARSGVRQKLVAWYTCFFLMGALPTGCWPARAGFRCAAYSAVIHRWTRCCGACASRGE